MSTLKLIALAVLTAGSSMAALASHQPVPVSSAAIIAPNTWHGGITALYLQPNFGGNGLGYSSFNNYGTNFLNQRVEINGATNKLSNIVPDRTWGFALDLGYDFAAINDVDLNWYHLNDTTNGNFPSGTLFAGSASALYAGQFNINTQWDAVNLVVGQHFMLNPRNMLRLYVGLNGSRIQVNFKNYPQIVPNSTPVFVTNDTITYTGIGPRLGGDYTYDTCYGFTTYAKAAGSLLVGTAKQSVTGYRDLGGFNLYSTGNYNQSNHNIVVPELEAKLGVKYNYLMPTSKLGLDVAYMFATYLGAMVSQVGSGVVSSSISNSSATNFNLNGPYIDVTWTGWY